ncbi:MAG TPA: condensation domain-containing protein, partial [Gemmatimonadaceae bacterium]|nr:condensation domain-containing protein [Gemmatimonadaceae bacterium]
MSNPASVSTRSIEAAFPLTPLQEGMLYHTIREPAAGTYHVQCSAYVDGALVPGLFARAWGLAVARHAALRTFFTWEGRERPLQVVRAMADLGVEHLDWRGLSSSVQDARWRELVERDRSRGFDLAAAPLTRIVMVQLAPERHRMLWSMHHAIMDGWSALLVLDEVMRDHADLSQGQSPARPVTPRFDRFVGWLDAQDRGRDEAFWRRTLADIGEPLALPGGRRRRAQSAERDRVTLELSANETRAVTAAAARLRVTVNTLLMGAWSLMLGRHAGRDDVLIGATVSERPAEIAGVDRAAGLYLSTVPVRAPSMRGTSLGAWLRLLQLELTEAQAHGAPGLAAIQRWGGRAATSPLFESLVVFENFPDDAMRPFTSGGGAAKPAGELSISSATMDVPNDVPLVLLALPGERLALNVVYDPEAVPASVAKRLPSQLSMILAQLAGDSARSLDTIEMLDESERRQLLDEWSGALGASPPATDVLQRFEQHAAARPDAVALRTESAGISYAD